MNHSLVKTFLIGILCQVLWSCSDVNFSPSDPENNQSLTLPNPPPPPTPPGPQPIVEKGQDVYYQQDNRSQVDILVVVDNSPSMVEEQEKMGDKISSFIDQLGDVDWQIGITTTDISGGKYSTNGDLLQFIDTNSFILTKGTPNYHQTFLKTITRPESNCYSDCPSSNEQPLRAAIMAMDKRDSQNQGFFRPNADFVLIIISDEDEMSTGPAAATTPGQVVDHVHSIWGNTKNFTTYAIIIQPGDSHCYDANSSGGGNYGTFAEKLVNQTGGLMGSICDADYGTSLAKIGERVKTLLSSFSLTEMPLAGSVDVQLTPFQQINWTLSGKNIVFSQPPSVGTKIEVNYMYQVSN